MWLLLPLLTLALVFGIVIGSLGGGAVAIPALVSWLLASVSGLALARRPAAGLLAITASALLGITISSQPAPTADVPVDQLLHCAVVVERTSLRDDGWSITGRLVASRESWNSTWNQQAYGRVVIHRAFGAWAPTFGDVLSVRAVLRPPNNRLHEFAFDPAAHARLRGIDASGAAESELILLSLGRGVRPSIDRLRVRLERSIVTRTDEREAGVLLAILTGDKSRLEPAVRASFAANGAAHVLAVSGLHLGLICLALYSGLQRVFRRSTLLLQLVGAERAAAFITLPATIGYVLLTGAPASAIRAGAMATVMLGAVILNRRPSGFHALCAAVFAMLVLNPAWLSDVGFQLSVTATCSLILTPKRPTDSTVAWLLEALRISAVASLATTPVLLWHFGATPVMSPITNLLVVPPIAFVALPLAIFGSLLDVFGAPGAAPVLWIAAAAVRLSVELASFGAPLLEISITWGRPTIMGLAAWTVLALASPYFGSASKRAHLVALVISVGFGVWDVPTREDDLVIHAIPAGQGDSTLVECAAGRILIDAPGARGRPNAIATRAIVPYLQGRGVRRLDFFVVSHGDLDHAGDAAAMILWGRPREVWLPAGEESAAVAEARVAAVAVGASVRTLAVPFARIRGDSSILAIPGTASMGRNDGGIVLRVCESAVCAVLAGDIEAPRETLLVATGASLRADYLKVPHHGSRTSSTDAFLDMIRPRVAVAHVGRANRFGFPHPDVVERYRGRGIRFRRTDTGRAIVWQTDGEVSWESAAYSLRSR